MVSPSCPHCYSTVGFLIMHTLRKEPNGRFTPKTLSDNTCALVMHTRIPGQTVYIVRNSTVYTVRVDHAHRSKHAFTNRIRDHVGSGLLPGPRKRSVHLVAEQPSSSKIVVL